MIVADLPEVDITDMDLLDDFIAGCRPDVVIHTAAMTAVDRCESEVDLAYRINELGSRNVAAVCKKYHSRLMAISTDYVFDGNKSTPYSEFDNATGGATVYGQSKFAGEKAVQQLCPEALILRTSWLYGSGGPSFVHTMVDLACQGKALKVVSDQWGNPTSALEVARKIRLLLEHPELRGVFHLTCEGGTNWFEFAMCYYSRYMDIGVSLYDAFYENMTYVKLCRSEEDRLMLQLIFANKTYELDKTMNFVGVANLLSNMMTSGEIDTLSSDMKNLQESAYINLKDFMDKLNSKNKV